MSVSRSGNERQEAEKSAHKFVHGESFNRWKMEDLGYQRPPNAGSLPRSAFTQSIAFRAFGHGKPPATAFGADTLTQFGGLRPLRLGRLPFAASLQVKKESEESDQRHKHEGNFEKFLAEIRHGFSLKWEWRPYHSKTFVPRRRTKPAFVILRVRPFLRRCHVHDAFLGFKYLEVNSRRKQTTIGTKSACKHRRGSS